MEKAAPKLVGNILHLHGRNWLKINWRKARYLFYFTLKKLTETWIFQPLFGSVQCCSYTVVSSEIHSNLPKEVTSIDLHLACMAVQNQSHIIVDKVLSLP